MAVTRVLSLLLAFSLIGCARTGEFTNSQLPVQIAKAAIAPTKNRNVIALFLPEQIDPLYGRIASRARKQAEELGTQLLVYFDDKTEFILRDIRVAAAQGAKGVIVYAPDYRDGDKIIRASRELKLKLLVTENDLWCGHAGKRPFPILHSDFDSVGSLSSQTMIKEAHRRRWDLSLAGVLLFKPSSLTQAGPICEKIQKDLLATGVKPEKIFLIDTASSESKDPEQAASIIMKENPLVSYWFIGASRDSEAVGGARALDDAEISPGRGIAIGVGGDGSVYDLERTQKSALFASVLLQEGSIGDYAVLEMDNWISRGVYPNRTEPFDPLLVDRENVRELKLSQHLAE